MISLRTRNDLHLGIKRRSALALGKIVTQVKAWDLIVGVRLEALQVLPDDRGHFAE